MSTAPGDVGGPVGGHRRVGHDERPGLAGTADDAPALVRIVRGDPDAHEVAALVAALLVARGRAGAQAAPCPSSPGRHRLTDRTWRSPAAWGPRGRRWGRDSAA